MSSVAVRDDLVIGVDIGGTKVAAGLVDPSGEILCHNRNPMVSTGGAASGLASVTQAIETASAQAMTAAGTHSLIRGIGICSPGPVDPKAGIIINPPNLPCWRNYPLAAEIAQIYRVRVKVDNDANAAGLAESLWGAGRGYHYVFYVTIGTGIGTALLIDGRIYHGRTGAAAEGGHMTIDYKGPRCGCGKPGCIEVLASGPAIARRMREKIANGVLPAFSIWPEESWIALPAKWWAKPRPLATQLQKKSSKKLSSCCRSGSVTSLTCSNQTS